MCARRVASVHSVGANRKPCLLAYTCAVSAVVLAFGLAFALSARGLAVLADVLVAVVARAIHPSCVLSVALEVGISVCTDKETSGACGACGTDEVDESAPKGFGIERVAVRHSRSHSPIDIA